MAEADNDKKFKQIINKFMPGHTLLRVWKLTGGISAQVTGLEITRPDGQAQKLIMRQHGPVDFGQNPNIAWDEFNLLHHLHAQGLPVPEPLFVDDSNEIFETPYIAIEFIEGESEFEPDDLTACIRQLAEALTQIHLTPDIHALAFLPTQLANTERRLKNRPVRLDDSISEGHIRNALEAAWPWTQVNAPVLLHGDYWPGNMLWQEGQLAAVIDWEDAVIGDPLADLGNSRLEILWAFGMDAMQQFTAHYKSMMPVLDYSNLPYWDLYMAIRPAFKIAEFAGDENKEHIMREQHRIFVAQAFEKLGE